MLTELVDFGAVSNMKVVLFLAGLYLQDLKFKTLVYSRFKFYSTVYTSLSLQKSTSEFFFYEPTTFFAKLGGPLRI